MNGLPRRVGATALAGLLIAVIGGAGPALAKGSDATIIRGACTVRADWKLKVKPDDGSLEVEFEVDSNRVGQRWRWRFRHDGELVDAGTRVTRAPSGSFSVQRRLPDAPGTHVIVARARNLSSGEVCRVRLRA